MTKNANNKKFLKHATKHKMVVLMKKMIDNVKSFTFLLEGSCDTYLVWISPLTFRSCCVPLYQALEMNNKCKRERMRYS